MHRIGFGTSGWRGILGEEFTLENIKIVTQAIADHLRQDGKSAKGLVVGYDSRFMGREFAREAVRVLAASGIPSYLVHRDTPTPVLCFELLRRGVAGSLNFTASHNPYMYNGIKFSPESGGPASSDTTDAIERRANEMAGEVCYREMLLDKAFKEGLVKEIDPRENYFARVRELVDLNAVAASGMRIAVNPLFGSARGYLDRLLEDAGVEVVPFHASPDPYFGGIPPEPTRAHLNDFSTLVSETPEINLGLATDADGDRFGIVDRDGTFIEPNYILALIYDYLIRRKGQQGNAARTVATSHFLDAVANHHGFEVLETPVGFKHIVDYLHKDRVLLGGEESAGLAIQGHIPDKDGILACLLVAEMMAVEGASVCELLQDLYSRVGEFYTRREQVRLTFELSEKIGEKLKQPPEALGDRNVDLVVQIDGCKLVLEDGAWVLFRFSGTEPVVRLYGEASSEESLDRLIADARGFLVS